MEECHTWPHTSYFNSTRGFPKHQKTASVLPVICSNSIPSMERLRTPPAANIRLCCKSWNSPDRLAMDLGWCHPMAPFTVPTPIQVKQINWKVKKVSCHRTIRCVWILWGSFEYYSYCITLFQTHSCTIPIAVFRIVSVETSNMVWSNEAQINNATKIKEHLNSAAAGYHIHF